MAILGQIRRRAGRWERLLPESIGAVTNSFAPSHAGKTLQYLQKFGHGSFCVADRCPHLESMYMAQEQKPSPKPAPKGPKQKGK